MGMRTFVGVALGAGLLVLFGSCGGGGGVPATEPGTSTLFIDVGTDSYSNGGATWPSASELYVGDNGAGDTFRALFVFDLSTIPPGAVVVGAWLHVSFLTRMGDPSDGLGAMRFVRYDSSFVVGVPAYSAPVLSHDSANDLLVTFDSARPRLGLFAPVASAIAAGDPALGLRIEYTDPTSGDVVSDGVDLVGLGHATEPAAQLEIVYQTP